MENKIRVRKRKPFIMLSHDFVRGELLDWNEKNIYMILLTYANSDKQCFPSIETLSQVWGKCDRTVRTTIRSLEEKGMLEKEVRITKKGQISNLYTLNDYEDVWEAKTVKEAKELISIEEKKKKLYELASELNFEVKEKNIVPVTSAPTKVTEETDTQSTQENYSSENRKSQEVVEENISEERYPLEWLKEHYEYDSMVAEHPEEQETIDKVIGILYESLNTTKKTVRVNKENKPTEVFRSHMMKLTSKGILYAIKRYKEQVTDIPNPTGYIRTLLYNAVNDAHFGEINQKKKQEQQTQHQQGETMPSRQEQPQSQPQPTSYQTGFGMTKGAAAYLSYPQRQQSEGYWDDLEMQLLAVSRL